MRAIRVFVLPAAVAAVVALLAANWRAQLRTQEKLDALLASLAERQSAPAPAAPPEPAAPVVVVPPAGQVPRELNRFTPPPYVIEAPDVLVIEAVLKDPKTGKVDRLPTQPISGPFLVRPDGTVGLGVWGPVPVSGLTLDHASATIRKQLAEYKSPELAPKNLVVVVDVLAYNSKAYYVITDAPGGGEQVTRLPLTGNETVLDAVANVEGLAAVAGKKSIRIARKSASGPHQLLPIDWKAIAQHGVTTTNYQILPGDRLYATDRGD